jgi:hypothetical protein
MHSAKLPGSNLSLGAVQRRWALPTIIRILISMYYSGSPISAGKGTDDREASNGVSAR